MARSTLTSPASCPGHGPQEFAAEPSRHEARVVEHDFQLVFGEGGRDHWDSPLATF